MSYGKSQVDRDQEISQIWDTIMYLQKKVEDVEAYLNQMYEDQDVDVEWYETYCIG